MTQTSNATVTTHVSGPTSPGSVLEYELYSARRGLALLKERLGHDGLRRLLEADIKAAEERWHHWATQSQGRFRPAVTELSVVGLTADEFLAHFEAIRAKEPRMLAAQPEHFIVAIAGDGFEVLENVGPYVAHFYVHFTDESQAIDDLKPDYPIRMVGYSDTADGTVHAHVLHHFRNTDAGFDAHLAVYFPEAVPDEVIEGHRQHLAIEFSNWITDAARALGSDTASSVPLVATVDV